MITRSPSDGARSSSRAGLRPGRLATLTALAAGLGALVGIVGLALFKVIALITNLSFNLRWSFADAVPTTAHLHAWVIVVPAIGGLLVGLIAHFGSQKIRGHGIDAVIESVLFRGSRIDPEIAILKPLSSAIVIGTGGPFGVEGPIIQTGGAVGSIIGGALHVTTAERKTLLAAGAAAGLAATFGTPIAATILAIELILFEYKPRSLIPLIVATGAATAVRYALVGPSPVLSVGPVAFGFSAAAPWYGLLGLLCGLAAVGFVRLLEWIEDGFESLHRVAIGEFWWPAIGGLVLGIVGYFVPRTLGSGYETIADLLNGRAVLWVVVGILLLKPFVVLVALGSRTSGGTLAPLLMSGAAFGSLFAMEVNAVWPAAALSPAACAIVAMAGFFAAAARAPLTLIFFAFELTRSFDSLLPLMLVVVAAHGVSLSLMSHSIMTLSLKRKGLPVHPEYEADVFQRVTVGMAMDPDVVTVLPELTVNDLMARIDAEEPGLMRHQAYVLADRGGILVGIVTRGDLVKSLLVDPSGQRSVLQAGTTDLAVAEADETVGVALDRMLSQGCGRLPVVEPGRSRRLVGYLGRTAILNARLAHLAEETERIPGWLTGWFGGLNGKKADGEAIALSDK